MKRQTNRKRNRQMEANRQRNTKTDKEAVKDTDGQIRDLPTSPTKLAEGLGLSDLNNLTATPPAAFGEVDRCVVVFSV